MSDSRDLRASPAGADSQTELRDNLPASEAASESPRAEQPLASKRFRVRIDPAHPIGDTPPEEAAAIADERDAVAPKPAGVASSAEAAIQEASSALPGADALSEVFSIEKLQQLRLQFEQLAGHLRSQQYQLDRREAQLHSQLAQQENDVRTSRLWFRERQQELIDREAEMQRRLHEAAEERAARIAQRDEELSRRQLDLESQRAALVENLGQRESELTRRESEFDLQNAQWSKERAEWAAARARSEAECDEAKRQWQEQADSLAERHRELEQLRDSLVRQSEEAEIAAAVRAAAEQTVAEHPAVKNAAEPSSQIAAQHSEEQHHLAEQIRADADHFYEQVASTLDLLRPFISGKRAKSNDNAPPVEAIMKPHAGPGLPPEVSALFGEFRMALVRLQGRQKNLEEAETLLTDGQSALDRGRQQLTADRQAWQEQCDIERRRIGDDRRKAEADLAKKLQTLAQRGDHLERRSAAVDQLRAEVLRAQRETLELRLATDEIWAQLSGSVPPPMLTQSLARIRSKLAEQYQLERAELAEQQKQLEALAARLEAQHEKLHHQKAAFEQWVADRRNEIEGQASRLVAQEVELARRQSELEEVNERQESERRLYEAEIRRLLGELRSGGISTTAAAA